MQPIDPLDYWQVAKELDKTSGDARLRAAVGRAYYALFLLAREMTGAYPVGSEKQSAHAVVIRAVSKRWGFSVGNNLYQLKELRRAADYELLPTDPAKLDWAGNWKTARDLVSRLLPVLRS